MPLKDGSSHEIIQDNIKELVRSGKNPKQAVAIAIATAHQHKKLAGGGVEPSEEMHTEALLADALLDNNEEREESATEPAIQPTQVLSDVAKQAIMASKKKRVFA